MTMHEPFGPSSAIRVSRPARAGMNRPAFSLLAALALAAGLVSAAASASGGESSEIAGLNVPRAGHTGTRLAGGGILIAGGENAAGVVRETEIFDPVSRRFSFAGGLERGRADHTATLLPDGRVFLLGGRDNDRALASTEIGDADGRAFRPGPALNSPRFGHTATALADGRIVIIGGDLSGSIEVFDPGIGSFRLIDERLSVPREFHSVALLHDGRILIAGGIAISDGSVLGSAELLDVATMTVSPAASEMQVPRAHFTLNVLPDGKVQAIGGDSRISMEMFSPTGTYFTARAGLLGVPGGISAALKTPARSAVLGRATDQEISSNGARTRSARGAGIVLPPDALDRIGASVTRNPSAGFALAAGGSRSSGLLSDTSLLTGDSSATVTTDMTDYPPGATVVITGAGWQPGETVSITLHEDDGDLDTILSSVADDTGGFVNSDFIVALNDGGVAFLVTATGESSGYTAQTTFTDANPGLNILGSDNTQHNQVNNEENLGNVAQGTSLSLTCPRGTGLTVKATGLGSGSTNWALGYFVGYGNDSTLSPLTTLTPSSGSFTSSSQPVCVAVAVTTGTLTVGTTYHGQLRATGSSGVDPADYFFKFTVTPGCVPIVINTQPANQTVCPGTSATFSVVATGTSLTYQWRKNGANIGGATSSGLTINPANPADNGSYDVVITDSCGGTKTSSAATLNASDSTAPVPNVSPLPDATGQCSVTVTAPTATDNCAGQVTATTADPLTYNSQGTFVVHWKYDDGHGNVTNQTQNVIVNDTTAPVPNMASLTDATGQCSVTVTPPTATDNCAGQVTATTADPLTYSSQGTFVVHWKYDDGHGNVTNQTQNVIVNDTEAPVPNASSLPEMNEQCSVTLTAPKATDNCVGQVTATTTDPTTYDTQGTFTVHWTYDDGHGNTSSQNQTVVIKDTTAPVPNASSLSEVDAQCSVNLTAPTATDNCVGPVTATTTDPTTYNSQGTFTVHWIYDDGHGNTSSQNQTVVIKDTTAPVPNVASLPAATGQCSVTVTAPTATDNCVGQVTATTGDPTTYNSQGTFTVHWTYDDGHGNTSSQNQTVIVKDTLAPTITTCPPAASALAGTGCLATVPDLRGSLSAVDNCTPSGSLVITQTPAPGTPVGPGVTTVGFSVADAVGNASTCSTTFTVTNDAPVVTSVTGPTSPLALGSPATVTAQFTDTGVQGHTCTFTWDDGTPDSSVSVGAGVTACSATHTYAAAGVNTIAVTVTDDCNAAGVPGVFQFIVIYDPNAGFVTGGGFINSPPGAYAADGSLTGQANFGFVSKYLKGAKVPTGETEFQFQVANFNFHSTVYQWLVISGPLAQYKGSGTVNGSGDYGFILTATDGQVSGGGGVDKFRIKIMDNNGGGVVYDNSPGSSDDINAANPQAIAGGSIVIHKN
jgi:hypothetical protein